MKLYRDRAAEAIQTRTAPGSTAEDIVDELLEADVLIPDTPPNGQWAEGPEWRGPNNEVVWTMPGAPTVMIQNVEPQLSTARARQIGAALLWAADVADGVIEL